MVSIIDILVNKQNLLDKNYVPDNLIFSDNNENTKKEDNDLILMQKLEEENEINNNINKRNRKFSNVDLIRIEEQPKLNKFSMRSLNSQTDKKSRKDFNDIFDEKGQLIISPILENMQDNNINKESSSESIRTEDFYFCYLKFEPEDLVIVSKEVEYIYIYRKNTMIKSSTLKIMKGWLVNRRTEIPDKFKSNYFKKYPLYDEEFELNINKIKKNKSINFSLDLSEINGKGKTVKYYGGKLIKLDDYEDSNDTINKSNIKKNDFEKDYKTDTNVKLLDDSNKDKNISEIENKEISISKKENKSINNENIKQTTENKEHTENISKKDIDNINNEEIINLKSKEIQMKNSQNSTQDIEKNKEIYLIQKKYLDCFIESGNNKNNNKRKLYKNNSVKQFNFHNNNKNIVNRTKNNLSVKKNVSQKTYNFYSPNEFKQMPDKNKNNKIRKKRIVTKNYGFKNKKEQEIELFNGAIEYLQNELNNNKNRNNLLKKYEITLGTIQKKYNKIQNENNKQIKNRNNKFEKKREESTISLTSTSTELIKNNNNNKNSIISGEISTNNENSNSSNMFQREMDRIMKFNKKLIKEEKKNGNMKRQNSLIFKNLKKEINNKDYNNKRMKKSISQNNFYEKRLEKTENEKTAYSKNKTKTNKYISPIGNQKSIYYINNKSINNNNSKNSSNYTKFNNNNKSNDNKFRFVLDKYVIYQNKTRNNKNKKNQREKKLKEQEKKRNNIEKENQEIKIQKSMGLNKYDFDKKENSKIVTTKKNSENIINNVINNNKNGQTNDSFFNDAVDLKKQKENENIIKNNNDIDNKEEADRVNTLCNDLGSDTNIKDLINLPFYIMPNYTNNVS